MTLVPDRPARSPHAVAGAALESLGLPVSDESKQSALTFPEGSRYRIEIPSVEGPVAFEAVLDAAQERGVPLHRVSQGSGIMLLTDDEIRRMVKLGADHAVEVCLFVGPRAAWDTGIQVSAPSGKVIGGSLRGAHQLRSALADVFRAVDLGLRSVLIADAGLLTVVGQLREAGQLPSDLVAKVSVSLPVANPATAVLLVRSGANTLNLPVDLSGPQISAIRQAVDVPLDLYIEGPDDFGAPVRYHELPELVAVAAPVYLKFTVRNAPGIYPSGGHLESVAVATARERVRRAAIGLELLEREGSNR